MFRGCSRGRWGLVPLGLAGMVILAGCTVLPEGSPDAGPASQSIVPTIAATGPVSPTAAASPTSEMNPPSVSINIPTPVPPPTATSARASKGLPVSQTTIRGRAASASWDVAVPVFSGPPVAAEANRRVRAAVNDLIGRVRREARDDGGVKRTLTGSSTVPTNDGRTVQVVILYTDYLQGTARPASFVTTTVVDIRRLRPVLLTQVIQNPPEALRFLRSEVIQVAKRKGEEVDTAGLAPKVANWANWHTSPAGLTFSFPEYQLGGAGIRSYTVPWSRARLVLSAYGERLLT